MKTNTPYILMLEDDSDDREVTAAFFAERNYDIKLQFATEGQELMQHLQHCLTTNAPLPSLILLDKYIQVNSGIETLKAIKAHPSLQHIPTVMISGSSMPQDIDLCYKLGANSYIVKPAYNAETARKIGAFVNYWFEVAELPSMHINNQAMAN